MRTLWRWLFSSAVCSALLGGYDALICEWGFAKGVAPKHYKNEYAGHELSWIDRHVPAKACLVCIPGAGMYANTYAPLGRRLSHMGIPTYAIDIRGFGPKKKGDAVHRLDIKRTTSDIERMLRWIHHIYPRRPVFLLGESLGGSIAIREAKLFPNRIDGIVCADPAWHLYGERWLKPKILLATLVRKQRISKSNARHLLKRASSKAEVREHLLANSSYRYDLTIMEAKAMLRFIQNTGTNAGSIKTTPTLFIQALHDRVVVPGGTAKLFKVLPTPEKTLVLDAHSEHFIFEEAQFSNQVVRFLKTWICDHSISKGNHGRVRVSGYIIDHKPGDQSVIDRAGILFGAADVHDWHTQ